MKRGFILISLIAVIFSSCSSIKEATAKREANGLLRQEQVRQALESNQFTIKMERLNSQRGPDIYLRADNNYIIVRGDMARINLAYIGYSWDMRGISGINLTGKVIDNSLIFKGKGKYTLKMKVRQNDDTFSVTINVGKSGNCDVSVTHPMIAYTRYHGQLSAI